MPDRDAPRQPGASFGPYEVLEELGRGGMGVVLRVREAATGRHLALKVLLQDGLTEERRRRFLREGEVTASLVHPGIVRVHAAHEGGSLRLVDGSGPREVEQLQLDGDFARSLAVDDGAKRILVGTQRGHLFELRLD